MEDETTIEKSNEVKVVSLTKPTKQTILVSQNESTKSKHIYKRKWGPQQRHFGD